MKSSSVVKAHELSRQSSLSLLTGTAKDMVARQSHTISSYFTSASASYYLELSRSLSTFLTRDLTLVPGLTGLSKADCSSSDAGYAVSGAVLWFILDCLVVYPVLSCGLSGAVLWFIWGCFVVYQVLSCGLSGAVLWGI
ncbi:hypothetical protein J6590_066844 [Homalodisca vitripennis]|nr:hypothetical protein J6590_066844 [Homalodisca vitripennis]